MSKKKISTEKPHPVDPTFITRYPKGFDSWYSKLRKTRAYNRVETETVTVQKQKYEKSSLKRSLLRIDVYEACFHAENWQAAHDALDRETHRIEFLKRVSELHRTAKKLEKAIKDYPREFNFIGVTVTRNFRKKGYTLKSNKGADPQNYLDDFLASLQEAVKVIADNPDNSSSQVENLYAFTYPLPPAVTTHYMCFSYPGGTNLSNVHRPGVDTALTIYLTALFRLYTAEPSLVFGSGWSFKELSKIGRPCWRQAATIALCHLGEVPTAGGIKRCANSSKQFFKRKTNQNILVARW